MDLFRITRKKYIDDLSGEGSRLYGGRWNHKGAAVIYTSESISLAAMEVLVHTSLLSMPDDLHLLRLAVPNEIQPDQIDTDALPDNWRTWPAPVYLMELGTEWIISQSSLLLKVPSSVIPMEWNVLINPRHPEFYHVKKSEISEFQFDERLISG